MAGNLFFITIVGFFFMLGLLYVFFTLYEKYFSLPKRREKDRAIMEALGDSEVQYNSSYYGSLAQATTVAENLPTRGCEKCGAALEPEDKFCPICGHDSEKPLFD